MQIKAVVALMQAGDFTFKEAAVIITKLEEQGLAIYKKKTPKLIRATINKPS